MGKDSKIEWTNHTFNPWWGCVKLSTGCAQCYAKTQANRFGNWWGKDAERRFFGEKHWAEPHKWNRQAKKNGVRAKVFCGSMCDVFEYRGDKIGQKMHDERTRLWHLILATPHLDWLLLTKRPKLAIAINYLRDLYRQEPDNVWLGVSVEDQVTADERIPELLKIPAKIRFLSVEPMLEKIDISAFIGYNPVYEEKHQGTRKDNLSSSSGQGTRNRFGGEDLENSQTGMGQVESKNKNKQVPPGKSRTPDLSGISSDEGNVQQDKISHIGTSSGIHALRGGDTRRNDSQSQKWDQVRQPSRKSGIDDTFRTGNPRNESSEKGANRSVGRKECNVETDKTASRRDKIETVEGRATEVDSNRLRSNLSGNIESGERRQMASRLWVICGGESGPNKRPFDPDWARSIRDQCKEAQVPFFMKQIDKVQPIPDDLIIREFPDG